MLPNFETWVRAEILKLKKRLAGLSQLTGDVTAGPGSGSQAATLSNTGVAAGSYGDATHVGQFTVDAKGRLSSASSIAITDTGITQLTGDVTAGPGSGSQAATIPNDTVTNAKLANMAEATAKMRAVGTGTGDPIDGTANQLSTLLDTATDPFLRTSAASGSYSDEQAQDAVGGILTDTSTIDFIYTDATPSITADVKDASITEAKQVLADNTTQNVTSTRHGYAPKSPADATKFLNGAATNAYAQVKDSDLSTSDITTNDVSTTKHGFTPKAPNDSSKFLRGDGTWAAPSGSSGGGGTTAMDLLVEATPSGTGVVTFSSISSAYRDLEVRVRGRGDTAAVSVNVQVTLNNDTGSHYERVRMGTTNGSTATAAASSSNFSDSNWNVGTLPAANASANLAGEFTFRVYDYRGTTFYKHLEGLYSARLGISQATWSANMLAANWEDTSAVNRIDLTLSAGNYVAGTVISLYGLL